VKALIDTNVLIDVFAQREPHLKDSARVWALVETTRVHGLVSAVSFANVYYIIRRIHTRRHAEGALELLRNIFTPVACDAAIINEAMDARFGDFEDAVQYFSARAAGAEVIVTRNTRDFPAAAPHAMTPAALLAALSLD
jgi:predicted nucleic acid-binding protein